VLRIPPSIDGADARARLVEIGRRVTDIVVQGDYHGGERRVSEIEHRLVALAVEMRGARR